MHHLIKSVYRQLYGTVVSCGVLLVVTGFTAWTVVSNMLTGSSPGMQVAVFCAAMLFVASCLLFAVMRLSFAPFAQLSRAILHVTRTEENVPAPELDKLRVGRRQITELSQAVYNLVVAPPEPKPQAEVNSALERLIQQAPVPLLAIGKGNRVVLANPASLEYFGLGAEQLKGVVLHEAIRMAFPRTITMQQWLDDCRANKVADTARWERVRLLDPHGSPTRQFDMAAHYSKADGTDIDTVIGIFDKTARYGADDQDLSFVAIAIHELRTPITMMRGYIEVFEDEIGPTLNPEMQGFMNKMSAAGQTLTTFVGNILNVARIESNQLEVHLAESDWNSTLMKICKDLELRARVRGKTIEYQLSQGLPSVGVDGVSVYEILSNLIENAVKYSGQSTKIIVKTYPYQGMVATTVQDFGIGIPGSLLPHLFEKFYRSHRSRTSVSGTGLGLFMCKAIVDAHGGQIWVESKEGEGSAFTFTLPAYATVAAGAQNGNNDGITREAHGWIKNHTLLR